MGNKASDKILSLTSNFEIMSREIPADIMSLLWFVDGPYTNCQFKDEEPSAISLRLEIDQNKLPVMVANQDLDYYPTYERLTPKQRFVYFEWLKDITQPIPIGYVFIFYYGLERHLAKGDFDKAFDVITKLRLYHKNQSFQAYSLDALLIFSVIRGRYDLLDRIDIPDTPQNQRLKIFVIAAKNRKFSAEDLMKMSRKVGFTNTRYITAKPIQFIDALEELLIEKFKEPYFPVSLVDIRKSSKKIDLMIANNSLRTDLRSVVVGDITTNVGFAKEIKQLLTSAHQKVKEYKNN